MEISIHSYCWWGFWIYKIPYLNDMKNLHMDHIAVVFLWGHYYGNHFSQYYTWRPYIKFNQFLPTILKEPWEKVKCIQVLVELRRVNVTLKMQCISTQLPILCFCLIKNGVLGWKGWALERCEARPQKCTKHIKGTWSIGTESPFSSLLFSSSFPDTNICHTNRREYLWQGYRLRSFNY